MAALTAYFRHVYHINNTMGISFFSPQNNNSVTLHTLALHVKIVEISPSMLLSPAINIFSLITLIDKSVRPGQHGEES